MDKYEYRVKTEQMLENMEKRQYKKAMEIADTIDWRRVKNAAMLSTVSEIYESNGEFQKSRDILLVAFDRSPNSRKIVYRLGTLALKINDTDAASDCYEEFVKLAPKDPNQYILKYKILRAQEAPVTEQITALSDFKKAEYVEKWAYELAKLYHEAGMTAECLEECDDLILWFSEGKYVYQAMELKMKYKPLTPLQQEKYDVYKGVKAPGARRPIPKQKRDLAPKPEAKLVSDNTMRLAGKPEIVDVEDDKDDKDLNKDSNKDSSKDFNIEDILADFSGEQTEEEPNATRRLPTGELGAALAVMKGEAGAGKPRSEEKAEESVKKDASGDAEEHIEEGLGRDIEENDGMNVGEEPKNPQKERRASITTVVKGATLAEALANGVAMANGINQEEKKKMEKREEEIRISGQMKIEDILQEWEEKQKANAGAIEEQKARDKERLKKEREKLEARREADRLEAERRESEEVARRKAAEEAARRKAEEEASKKAEEARRRAEEKEAAKKAEAARRKAEEKEAARKAEEAKRRAEEEEARRKAEEEARRKAEAEEAARKEEEARRRAEEEEARRKAEEEEAAKKAAVRKTVEKASQRTRKKTVLSDDIRQLVEELESRVSEEHEEEEAFDDGFPEIEFENDKPAEYKDEDTAAEDETVDEDEFGEEDLKGGAGFEDEAEFDEDELEGEDEFAEDDLEDEDEFDEDELEDEAEFAEDELEDEDEFAEDELDEDDEFDEDELEDEAGFDEEALEDEDEFEEDEDEFDEDEFEEDEDEFDEDELEDEDEFDEDEFEEDEDEFDEDELEDEDEFDEDEFDEDEDEFDEDEFEEDEDEFDEDEFEEDEDEFDDEDEDELPKPRRSVKEEPLEIEEPSEEEIQKRIKKAKGKGVPFDTGFVVTGRYDLSATSEIGLKAGLTEEQKKLFSYFVPVRGMSEQIVEVLDNDRRVQREGTSKTGNILVLGRKGSGKTVLAVDVVKAIQKQRNLKQGKVAIVTGESLNKKELTNIFQKLRGGAIIVEKAGKLNSRTIKELNQLMEKKTGEMLVVLEDQRKPLERILTANPDFKKKFTSRLELPTFINDELVTFGQTYAKENGYKLDEMGILALYSRIDVMQREDHAVTVAEVKEIMDEAIEHSQKANVKHLARRMFGRSTDDADRVILKEEDFRV